MTTLSLSQLQNLVVAAFEGQGFPKEEATDIATEFIEVFSPGIVTGCLVVDAAGRGRRR